MSCRLEAVVLNTQPHHQLLSAVVCWSLVSAKSPVESTISTLFRALSLH